MDKVQKTYTAEFKREAVRLAQTSGKLILPRFRGSSATSVIGVVVCGEFGVLVAPSLSF